MIDACRAVLRAFTGLELVEVNPTAPDAINLGFGPGGDRWLVLDDTHVEVAGGDGGAPERFRRRRSGHFRDGHRDAAVARIGTLLGRTLSSIEHGRGNRLTLRFAGGGGIRLVPRVREVEWLIDHEGWRLQLDAGPALGRSWWPERAYELCDDDGPVAAEASVAGRMRASGRPRPRAADLVASLTSLPLTGSYGSELLFGAVVGVAEDGGPQAEIGLLVGDAGITVAGAGGGAPVEVREPGARYELAALEAALAPLLGRRPATVDLGDDGGLELAFAGGGGLVLSTDRHDFPIWHAADAGTRRSLDALPDGSLVARGWYPGDDVPEVGVWGSLGVLRPLPFRPRRPLPPPRDALPGGWAHVLGGLAGRRLASVEETRPAGLKLLFDPLAVVLAESCHVTVDDGAARVRHHRDGDGRLGDRAATAAAAVRALAGRTVAGVALGEDLALTLALAGGAAIVLERNAWELSDWELIDRRSDRCLSSPPVIAETGDDAARLRVDRVPEGGLEVVGELGRVSAAGWVTAATGPLGAARELLAAPLGLPVTEVRAGAIELGEEDPRDRYPTAPVYLRFGWCSTLLAAPGERGGGRVLADDARQDALTPLLGVRVAGVEHRSPGRLVLAFADGHRLALEPTVTVIPAWSAALRDGGPWIAAMDDGSLRAMPGAEARVADASGFLYGPLGRLPAYGVKS